MAADLPRWFSDRNLDRFVAVGQRTQHTYMKIVIICQLRCQFLMPESQAGSSQTKLTAPLPVAMPRTPNSRTPRETKNRTLEDNPTKSYKRPRTQRIGPTNRCVNRVHRNKGTWRDMRSASVVFARNLLLIGDGAGGFLSAFALNGSACVRIDRFDLSDERLRDALDSSR